ncbi:MAG TPA: aldose 1-epimerase family protein [Clostridiaceae bacterium]|nr:aldose 1-epimerase family protein [Clostridiaceae bacterium]
MIYTIENDLLKIQINSLGAELWSFYDKKNRTEHLWQGDEAYWPGRAPVLFPYCGRLKDKRYFLDNKEYGSGIHGFASHYEHTVVYQDSRRITFLFEDNVETMKVYPYRFRLYSVFELEGSRLAQTLRVENPNEGDMYFSLGFHTGFMLPFDDKRSIEDYTIVFDTDETPYEIMCNSSGLLSGGKRLFFENKRTIPLHHRLFANDSFILSGLKSEHVSIVEKDTGKAIRVRIKGFPYTVFWSTPNEVRFVCIEPWYGLPDMHDTDGDFTKKPGILKLTPDQSFSCQQTIESVSLGDGGFDS